MDFGALQCTPQRPACAACPLQESCVALSEGRVGQLPVKQNTLQVRERRFAYIYIRYKGQTAIRRRGEGDIWQGLWKPLFVENGELSNYAARCKTPHHSVLDARLIRQSVRHVLTHRVLLCDFYLWEPEERPSLPEGYIWVDESDLDQYALPRLVEKLLEMLPVR
jgi:A/G-specific adenine glycosylase